MLGLIAVAQLVVAWPGVLLHDGPRLGPPGPRADRVGHRPGRRVPGGGAHAGPGLGHAAAGRVLVACMVGASVLDALSGHTLLGPELVHVLELAGLGCLWVLARRVPRPSVVVRLA